MFFIKFNYNKKLTYLILFSFNLKLIFNKEKHFPIPASSFFRTRFGGVFFDK